MPCPPNSISYNGSQCACVVGYILNQTTTNCVLFAASSTISTDNGVDSYSIRFAETIFSFDSIKKFTQSQAVFLEATLVFLLSWLCFCFFFRFMKLNNDVVPCKTDLLTCRESNNKRNKGHHRPAAHGPDLHLPPKSLALKLA
ncbi:hypothetical protein ACFX1Q_034499 [Malus domestica]